MVDFLTKPLEKNVKNQSRKGGSPEDTWYPLCAIDFSHLLKGFSKEIDHLSLVDFFCTPELFRQDLEFGVYCFQLKEFWGLQKGFEKRGSTRKGIEKQI